ncbi:translation initiation factor IF-2 [Streptomyces violaceusniger Tu 4113]|uniref:Translation initiation factor IF-2 n=1 Tax=Streptomyces violaceusniger (strain Tu 4113) TaxID=653045 RepID=G2P8F7_STRV4|nr:translation initiation factor IF-2 [Streptomyces violaceusniger Tu 4113]
MVSSDCGHTFPSQPEHQLNGARHQGTNDRRPLIRSVGRYGSGQRSTFRPRGGGGPLAGPAPYEGSGAADGRAARRHARPAGRRPHRAATRKRHAGPGTGPAPPTSAPASGCARRIFPLPAPSRYQGLRPWTPDSGAKPHHAAEPHTDAAGRHRDGNSRPDPARHQGSAPEPRSPGQSPTTRRSRTPMPQEGTGTATADPTPPATRAPPPNPGVQDRAPPHDGAAHRCHRKAQGRQQPTRPRPPPGLRPRTPESRTEPHHAAEPHTDAAGRHRDGNTLPDRARYQGFAPGPRRLGSGAEPQFREGAGRGTAPSQAARSGGYPHRAGRAFRENATGRPGPRVGPGHGSARATGRPGPRVGPRPAWLCP